MALTEKMLDEARKLMDKPRGPPAKYTDEQILNAYLTHGSLFKAAASLGCALNTVQRRMAKLLKGEQ